MKMQKDNQRWLRWAAGFLCLPVCYMAASASLPYISPFLEQAVIISSEISFPFGGFGVAGAIEEEGSSAGRPDVLAGVNDTELTFTEPESQPDSSEEEVQSTPEKPENAGTVRRTTYSAGSTSVYIPVGKGSLKNCTSLSTQTIAKTVAQAPAFSIKGMAPRRC